MKVADLSVKIVNDGSYLVDGGTLFGQVPKAIWEQTIKPDRKNRIRLGLNCLLIQTGGKNILVDTGIGSKETETLKELYGLKCNKLLTNLKANGLTARQIDIVILTHLHFDHAGGSTKIDRTGRATPTFPKATYIVQKDCWEEAINPTERVRDFFHPHDFMPLQEKGQLSLIDGDCEIVPNVTLKVMNGHSKGDQLVLVNCGGEKIAYGSHLVPTIHHVPLRYIPAFDLSPEDTMAEKIKFLDIAQSQGWLLVFAHGMDQRAGYVENLNGRTKFRLIEF